MKIPSYMLLMLGGNFVIGWAVSSDIRPLTLPMAISVTY